MQSFIKYFILNTLIICSFSAFSQKQYRLDFHIKDLPDQKLWIIFYYGDQQVTLDTAFTDEKGNVEFVMDDKDEPGMYRLQKGKQSGLDFVFNKENMELTTENDFRLEGIQVKGSKENEIFYDYYRHKFDMEDRLDVLHGFLRYYPTSDTFYFTVANHTERLATQYQNYLDSITTHFPNLMVTHIIQFDQLPDIRPGDLDATTRNLYRANYFSGVDLNDTLILNTPILPVKVIDYLSLYVIQGATKDQQEALFSQAVDSLMKFTENSPKVREMVVNYLINGFQTYGFENVLTHLVENYVIGQSCVSDQEEAKLKVRIDGFKKLAVGTMAPDFEINDSKGNPVKLSALRGKTVVLIFWSSTCPHCEAIMQELNNLYAQYGSKDVFVGISIDDDEKLWRKALDDNKLLYINAAELQGWNGKIIQDYFVYATPTFIVIDPSGKITAKPTGVGELRAALEK